MPIHTVLYVTVLPRRPCFILCSSQCSKHWFRNKKHQKHNFLSYLESGKNKIFSRSFWFFHHRTITSLKISLIPLKVLYCCTAWHSLRLYRSISAKTNPTNPPKQTSQWSACLEIWIASQFPQLLLFFFFFQAFCFLQTNKILNFRIMSAYFYIYLSSGGNRVL